MPGIIDIHTHYDAEIEIAPSLEESVRHGVTTIVMGSCGLTMIMGDSDELCDMFTRVGLPSGYIKNIIREAKTWDSPIEYLDHLETLNLGPNVAMFLGTQLFEPMLWDWVKVYLQAIHRPRRSLIK